MTYREPLPAGCPPETAQEILTEWRAFRLVRDNPPREDDFRSQRWQKPTHRFHGVTECQARGLSIFAQRDDAERALRLPSLRGRFLCVVQLEAGAGYIQKTGRGSHYTWWPLAAFDILGRCAVETS